MAGLARCGLRGMATHPEPDAPWLWCVMGMRLQVWPFATCLDGEGPIGAGLGGVYRYGSRLVLARHLMYGVRWTVVNVLCEVDLCGRAHARKTRGHGMVAWVRNGQVELENGGLQRLIGVQRSGMQALCIRLG